MKKIISALLLSVGLNATALAAPPMYRVVDIGGFPETFHTIPIGLNADGVVVGSALGKTAGGSAFIWTAETGIRKIRAHGNSSKPLGIAYDINDNGQILGGAAGGPDGNGGAVVRNLDGDLDFFLFGTWAAERFYNIVQITNSGQVLGQSYVGSDGSTVISPWLWSENLGLVDVVDIVTRGIDGYHVNQMNNKNQIVGYKFNDCRVEAFLFDAVTRRTRWLDRRHASGDCRTESVANAINDHGQVVGWNQDQATAYLTPYIWSESAGAKRLSGSAAPNRTDVVASDINNAGQVVGRFQLLNQFFRTSFFYWDEENGFHDLKKLLDPTDPMTAQVVLQAYNGAQNQEFIPKINDRGQILLTGSLRSEQVMDGARHAFLLVPVQP